jgi:hypothetical protein
MLDPDDKREVRRFVREIRSAVESELAELRTELEELREEVEDLLEFRVLRGAPIPSSKRPEPPPVRPIDDLRALA